MSTTVRGPGEAAPAELPAVSEPPIPAPDPAEPQPLGSNTTIDVNLDKTDETVEEQIARQLPPGPDDVLFDGKPYQSLKPNVDDEDTDKAKVTITGSWDIDLEDPADVAWFNRVMRGQSVDLRIEAECTDRIAPYKRNPDTDEATITGVMKLKVTHVHRLTPEDL